MTIVRYSILHKMNHLRNLLALACQAVGILTKRDYNELLIEITISLDISSTYLDMDSVGMLEFWYFCRYIGMFMLTKNNIYLSKVCSKCTGNCTANVWLLRNTAEAKYQSYIILIYCAYISWILTYKFYPQPSHNYAQKWIYFALSLMLKNT